MQDLPDWQHIQDIKKRLWSNREFGQAAIMVGAGFSRNAEKSHGGIPDFPLWGNVGDEMYSKLYPDGTFASETEGNWHHISMTSGSGLLRLANEYEATFGRLATDDLLVESIPDNLYRPGSLHRLLLSLPWSDVFTTNYDTLLERTQPYIHDRKYDVIRTFHDIPGRMKPRIVKLHGSFPAHRPFIITEDDFRSYPAKFGAFVNIVQQSIMENAFCLVGFSGEDPNFLSWAGWVRDRLGASCPPIYLCGIFNHSPSLKRLLERRNVITIDLGPLIRNSNTPKGQVHSIAVEWFLRALHQDDLSNRTQWLDTDEVPRWSPPYNLPSLPRSVPPVTPISPHSSPVATIEDLQNLLIKFAYDRGRYPGWIVVPENRRDKLWMETEPIVFGAFDKIDKLPLGDDLKFLSELNWRIERCLVPIENKWLEKYISIVEKYNPFPKEITIPGALTPDVRSGANSLDWTSLDDIWVELSFSIIRKCREEFREEEFAKWLDRMHGVRPYASEWMDRWYYEKSLGHIFSLDPEGLLRCLDEWNITSTDLTIWKHRRAALFAELGEVDRAEKLATEVLSEIRSRYQPYNIDAGLLSQEAWVMVLLKSLNGPFSKTRESFHHENRSRWQWLESQGYDPWELIEKINVRTRLIESDKSDETITEGFDPRQATTSFRFGQPSNFERILPAYSALRLFEESGLPVEIPTGLATVTSAIDTDRASSNIYPLSPTWALTMMVRADKKDSLNRVLTRARIATLDSTEVQSLFKLFFGSIEIAAKKLSERRNIFDERNSFHQSCLYLNAEILSRLAFRLDETQVNQLLDFALSVYEQPFVRDYPTQSKLLEPLLKRGFYVLSDPELLKRLEGLLSLPIPNEGGFGVGSHADLFINPFDHIAWKNLKTLPEEFDWKPWVAPLANLIRVVQYGSTEARKQALVRILLALEVMPVDDSDLKNLFDAIWIKTDATGLPVDTDLHYGALTRFAPTNEVESIKDMVRNLLLGDYFPRNKDYIDECLSASVWDAVSEKERALKLDWKPNEVSVLLHRAVCELRRQLPSPAPGIVNRTFGSKDANDIVREFLDLLGRVILPKLDLADSNSLKEINMVIADLELRGYSVTQIRPALLRFYPERFEATGNELRIGLNALDENQSFAAILSLYLWLLSSASGKLPEPPQDLFNDLINKVLFRRQPRLEFALDFVALIIRKRLVALTERMLKDLSNGLQFLLEDTNLSRESEAASKNTVISFEQRPKFRGLAARLALAIEEYFAEQSTDLPEPILKWKSLRLTDFLPEVRFPRA